MLTLNDGRSELWQWDTGRTLSVDADCSQVHFSNKVFGRSIDVGVVDGVAIIPDVLLQTDKDLSVWAFVGTAENGYTKISKTFKVNRRNKPADYVFTPPDQTTLAELSGRLDRIEESQDPDAIKNAVDAYLQQNPVEAPVQSVNGQTGTVALTAEDVGAISKDNLQTATNDVLAQAKASGEFDGADGVSIQSVEQTTTSTEDGGTNVVTVTKTDGTSSTFQIKNGSRGSTGPAGADGVAGADGHTPVKGTDYFTETDKQEIAEQAAGMVSIPDKLPNPNALTFTGAVTGIYDGSAPLEVNIPSVSSSGNCPTWSDLQMEMPMGASELLNAVRIQNAANNATLLSTQGNLAHNAMAEMCGGIVFVTWTENTAGTTVDHANGSGNCSVFGRMLRYKFGISQNTPVWSDMTDAMDLFPIGSTVYGADGSELGTIIDVSDSTIYSPDKGMMYVSAMAYCSDINGQRPVTRTITFDSSLKTSNITNDVLVFGTITAWTLTIDGASGDYDFSRINSSYKKRPQINSKPIPNNLNNRTGGFLIPVVIDNVGVAVLESTDAMAWNLLCILPDADAHMEASMFLAAEKRWFIAIRCKKNNIPSIHIIKVNTDTYTVLDGWYTKLRGTDSRPSFLNNFTSTRFANYPILFLSDYNRKGGRIVIIEDSDPQHVRTIATLRDNLSNYTQVLNPYNSANWGTTMKQIVLLIGTNGDASEKRGVSVAQVFLDHTQYNDIFDMVNLLSSGAYELPIASETTLGGVKPSAKTDSMTKPVGVDENGGLFVEPSNGATETIDTLINTTLKEEASGISVDVASVKYKAFMLRVECVGTASNDTNRQIQLMINNKAAAWTPDMVNMTTAGSKTWATLKVDLYDDCVWYFGTNTKTTNNTTMNGYINGITTDVNRDTVVTALTVRAFNAWSVLGAGTKINLKGIRA